MLLEDGYYGLPSFEYLAVAAIDPITTPSGLRYARPSTGPPRGRSGPQGDLLAPLTHGNHVAATYSTYPNASSSAKVS